MQTGEFSARRLTVARQLRELSKKDLATRVGLSPQAVTLYEDGKNQPEIANARRIAEELDFPLSFFYKTDIESIPLEAVSWRSRRSMTARTMHKTKAAGEVATDAIVPILSRRFKLPAVDVPDLSGESPEVAADLVRAAWGLGRYPVAQLIPLLEAKGIRLFWFNDESTFVDALCFWRDSIPYIMMSNRDRGGERLRFDVAHELAHIVLHRRVKDLDAQSVEAEADRFASCFLMPGDQFAAECPKYPTLNQLLTLKPRWKVSLRAMVRRCRDLGILSQWQYECAQRDIMVKKIHIHEPGRLDWEKSELHRLMLNKLVELRIYPEDLARDLGITVADLTAYIPQAAEYLNTIKEDSPARFLTIEELGYTEGGSMFTFP